MNAITTPFCRASLHRDKTGGILTAKSPSAHLLAWLPHHLVLLLVFISLCAALILSALTASFFVLLGLTVVPFYLYIALKSVFSSMLDTFATCTVLYTSMFQAG